MENKTTMDTMDTKTFTRQEFVGGALAVAGVGAVVALGVASIAGTPTALADETGAVAGATGEENSTAGDASAGLERAQYGFWSDTEKCVDCGKCIHACRRHNNTPEGVASRRKVVECLNSAGKTIHISVSCMHCSTPTCLEVCPAGAIYKRPSDGIVGVDKKKCIGCKYCYQACPFGVPHYTDEGMDKCDACLGNGAYPKGDPWCVNACPEDALHFGNIQDLLAAAGSRGKQFSAVTGPSLVLS